jgi:hypothetical protein
MCVKENYIFRKPKDSDHPFTRADKGFINDSSISFKAKGIMLYLLDKPDYWVLRHSDLKNNATDSDTSIRNGIRELEQAGYIRIQKHIDGRGRVNPEKYWIFEERQTTPIVDDYNYITRENTR